MEMDKFLKVNNDGCNENDTKNDDSMFKNGKTRETITVMTMLDDCKLTRRKIESGEV